MIHRPRVPDCSRVTLQSSEECRVWPRSIWTDRPTEKDQSEDIDTGPPLPCPSDDDEHPSAMEFQEVDVSVDGYKIPNACQRERDGMDGWMDGWNAPASPRPYPMSGIQFCSTLCPSKLSAITLQISEE